ncbi:MAG: cation:proton antiporter [Candidatus Dormibacteria bacterium]|jgi:Kef-type K+ transport system membrane component KefB
MFAQLTILVLAGLAGPLLAFGKRGLIPVVIGELIAGFVLGQTGFGIINSAVQPLPVLSSIGFAMLMFTAGTHVDIGSPAIRQGFARGVLALALVAVTAVPIGLLLDHALGVGHPALIAVILTGSSAAIAFPILEERGLSGPNVAFLIAWVALADSVTVIIMPLTLAKSGSPLGAIGGDLAIIAAGVLALFAAMKARQTRISQDLHAESLQRGWAWQVRVTLVLLLGLSAIAQKTGASTLVAGFLAGMILVRLHESDRLAVQFTGVANGFFVPLFFVLLGAELNLRALLTSPSRILLALGLAVGAVITHLIAARIAGHEKYIATGMAASAQLGMPAAAASLGLSTGLLSPAEAAALVAGGVLTLIPATIGSLLLARGAAPVTPAAPPGSTATAPT